MRVLSLGDWSIELDEYFVPQKVTHQGHDVSRSLAHLKIEFEAGESARVVGMFHAEEVGE